MPEFFNPACLSAILLFALNNHYLKQEYSNWLTGKLSDITACFFLPLFISAMIRLAVNWPLKKRLMTASIVTATVFVSVKTIPWASDMLNTTLSSVTLFLGIGQSINRVDPSDLLALPMIFLAYYFGKNTRHA